MSDFTVQVNMKKIITLVFCNIQCSFLSVRIVDCRCVCLEFLVFVFFLLLGVYFTVMPFCKGERSGRGSGYHLSFLNSIIICLMQSAADGTLLSHGT